MIQVEDSNNEKFHINPNQVIYVKERFLNPGRGFKILLSNGEVIMTRNEEGARKIINCIKCKMKS